MELRSIFDTPHAPIGASVALIPRIRNSTHYIRTFFYNIHFCLIYISPWIRNTLSTLEYHQGIYFPHGTRGSVPKIVITTISTIYFYANFDSNVFSFVESHTQSFGTEWNVGCDTRLHTFGGRKKRTHNV